MIDVLGSARPMPPPPTWWALDLIGQRNRTRVCASLLPDEGRMHTRRSTVISSARCLKLIDRFRDLERGVGA